MAISRTNYTENNKGYILPRLYGAKLLCRLQSRRCTHLHRTFIVQYNKEHHIVVHCQVIVASQST